MGPDFIDPGYHSCITGTASHNLDGWMLTKAENRAIFSAGCVQADIAVVEGVMGLFDGYSGTDEAGSTAQMAKWLDLPVILVVDASSMARSVAALVQGFTAFDPFLSFAGVVFNNLGSRHHHHYLKEALEHYTTTPVLGGILRDTLPSIPERHLGLVTHFDHGFTREQSDTLGRVIETSLDIDRLVDALPDLQLPRMTPIPPQRVSSPGVSIAIAHDNAFCFYYPDNLDALKKAGAELHFFSPMSDQRLPSEVDGLYLGGGYPELYAEQLARNRPLKQEILRLSRCGMPIYAECGGFMYLGESITDVDERRFPMVGCFPLQMQMHDRLKSLGYREVTLRKNCILGVTGEKIRGHEFHYSDLAKATAPVPESVYHVTDRNHLDKNTEGYRFNNTIGSYIHLHFRSNPGVARAFVHACKRFSQARTHKELSPHETG